MRIYFYENKYGIWRAHLREYMSAFGYVVNPRVPVEVSEPLTNRLNELFHPAKIKIEVVYYDLPECEITVQLNDWEDQDYFTMLAMSGIDVD